MRRGQRARGTRELRLASTVTSTQCIEAALLARVVGKMPKARGLEEGGGNAMQTESGTRPVLEVADLTLSFGGLHALSKVSFAVQEGTITAVIGPNGAGKTSLFNCISGFYRPQHGAIWCEARDITRLHPPERAKLGLARTFQNIALFRGMTVLDNIKLGRHVPPADRPPRRARLSGPGASARKSRCAREIEERIIDFLEIDHIRHRSGRALPYGLQKRVELARALAMQPAVLMLDEPVAGMNREETEDMARFILDVQEEWGITVLMVEHDMGMVMDISDHVVVLNFGQVIAQRNARRGPARSGGGPRLSRGPAMPRQLRARRRRRTGGVMGFDGCLLLREVTSRRARRGRPATRSPALAFVLIYKATRVVNLAIGEMLMIGAYVFFGSWPRARPAGLGRDPARRGRPAAFSAPWSSAS